MFLCSLLYGCINICIIPGEADAYCIIKCEGESVRTPIDKKTSNPKWNTTAIFYRTKPEQPLVIEVRKILRIWKRPITSTHIVCILVFVERGDTYLKMLALRLCFKVIYGGCFQLYFLIYFTSLTEI